MKGKRIVSLLLCLVLTLGLLPGITIPAAAADETTYTKYNLSISACISDNGSTWTSTVEDAIDFTKSTITCWYLQRGKTPKKRDAAVLSTVNNGYLTNLIFEPGSENYNQVTLKIYLKEGYAFDERVSKALAYKDVDHTQKVTRWSCSTVGAIGEDGSRTYTYTADPKRWNAESTLYLGIAVTQTGAAKKTVTLRPIMAKTETTTVTVTEGEKLPNLSEALQTFDPDYFSVAEVENWYTKYPTRQSDGTYKYDETAIFSADTPITDNITLYAKPKVKAGAKLPAVAYLPMYEPLSDSNLQSAGRLTNWLYTPQKKAEAMKIDAAGKRTQFWSIPIGSAWKESEIPATGAYGTILNNAASVSIPKAGAELNNWWYKDDSGTWHELKVGAQISSDFVQKMLDRGSALLALYPVVTLTGTIKLDTGAANLNLGPYTVQPTIDKQNTKAAYLTADEQADIAAKIQGKENTDSFKKLFRGWYLSKNFSGTRIDLATRFFYSDATLYARWEDAYTLHYDFGIYHPTNQNAKELYKDQPIANGDKLTEPTRPEAGSVAFVGWYKDEARTEAWNFAEETVSNDVTLYAKFEDAKQIPVTFKYARAANPNAPETAATYPNTPIAAEYPFGALPVLPGKTREEYDKSTWELKTIYYDDEGGKRTLTYTGWAFTDRDEKQQPLTETTVLANYLDETVTSLDVYATYTTSFQFIFDLAGGSTTRPDEVKTVTISAESGTVQKPTVEPTKNGYDFGGWVDASGSLFDFEKEYNENTTIKAKWVDEREYTVKFKLTPADAVITVKKQGSDTEIKPATSENGNVTFKLTKGTYVWSVSADGYKTIHDTKTIDKKFEEGNPIEVTLPAFQSVTGITLNLTKIMQKKSYDLSSLATVAPENASNKTIAWTVSENDGVTLGADGKTLTVSDAATGSVTLTATIANGTLNEDGTTEKDYTETFTLTIVPYQPTISFNAGTGPAAADIKNMPAPVLAVDSKISAPTSPTASGWTFEGWYLDTACESAWTADHAFSADATLYAKWTKNPVAVTITFAGGEGTTLNTGATGKHEGMSGDKITLPACMYTKPGYIFRSWDGTFAGAEYTLPEEAKTFTAQWTQITSAIVADDINHALDGISADNAKNYKPQLLAARDALAAGTATKTDAALINKLSNLFVKAGLGSVTIAGDAKQGVSEVGTILSSDGSAVVLNINKQTTAGKALPTAYQNEEYKSAWRTISMTVGGATTDPKVPVILSLPIPTELSGMAADTIRVLAYKGAATEPVVLTPTVSDGKLTFGFDGNGTFAFVGKEISDAADTRVTALVMKYNGTKMGNVEQDASGNFTVTLPSTTSESVLQDLSSGINSKWLTYLTVAPQAKVKPSDGADQTADYWANTGLALTYSLSSSNSYSQTRSFTVTAANGTTRTFTVTVKKITDADRNYKIAVSNINGGTVTATPSPAAAGEEVKLTVTPNDGKKLVAGSLSYCLQSAGAKSVPIDESSLTFIMPAGDININAQFEDDANAPLKNPPQITAFVVNGVSAVINSDTKAITIILPYGTDLRHVAPTIVTANASKVEPSSAQRVDLSTPKAYRVYASNGAYVTYTVTAYTEEPSPTQSLWEKLQNQINSNPNWWELAEYQKKTGYYK